MSVARTRIVNGESRCEGSSSGGEQLMRSGATTVKGVLTVIGALIGARDFFVESEEKEGGVLHPPKMSESTPKLKQRERIRLITYGIACGLK
jgi:hypothetical protein